MDKRISFVLGLLKEGVICNYFKDELSNLFKVKKQLYDLKGNAKKASEYQKRISDTCKSFSN
ncbi:MAG: hypothetical protein JXA66_02760 [Oligoflexia bacterium]|nr:hypothetical protein [Oligoflexia bacterium]